MWLRIMEFREILVSAIIALVIGSVIGFAVAPRPDVSGLNLQIDELQQEVSTLQDEKNDLETSLQGKNNEVSTLEAENQQLQDQISQLSIQLPELNASLASISIRLVELNESLASRALEFNQLKEEYNEISIEYHALQSDYNTKLVQIRDLEAKTEYLEEAIIELEEKIDALQKTYEYSPGTWNIIKSWPGSADKTTELFYVLSDQMRIIWDLKVGENAYFDIKLYDENGDYIEGWLSLHEQPSGHTYAYIDPGFYHLEFFVLDCYYTVKVEVVVP